MKTILISLSCLLLCGCADSDRMFLSGIGAAGGTALGYGLSGGSMPASAGGAAAGALAAEGIWTWKTQSEKRNFETGYVQGRGDAAKALDTRLDNDQAPHESTPRYRRFTITIPARREGGVLYEPQTRTILIAE